MTARRGRKTSDPGKATGRKGTSRRKQPSGGGDGPQSGRIEYGPILSVPEAAQYLRVTVRTIYRLKAAGDLPFARIGGRVLFRRQDIETFVDSRIRRQA